MINNLKTAYSWVQTIYFVNTVLTENVVINKESIKNCSLLIDVDTASPILYSHLCSRHNLYHASYEFTQPIYSANGSFGNNLPSGGGSFQRATPHLCNVLPHGITRIVHLIFRLFHILISCSGSQRILSNIW